MDGAKAAGVVPDGAGPRTDDSSLCTLTAFGPSPARRERLEPCTSFGSW